MGNAVAFLGFCDKAGSTSLFDPRFSTLDLIGLTNVVFPRFYPSSIPKKFMVLAVRNVPPAPRLSIRVRDETQKELMSFSLTSEIADAPVQRTPQQVLKDSASPAIPVAAAGPGWTVVPVSLEGWASALPAPGSYSLVAVQEEQETRIGTLYCGHIAAAPLTPERIAAIKSDPRAIKSTKVEVQCKLCKETFRAYAGIERLERLEEEGYLWNIDLPARWRCSCGAQDYDLRYMKTGLHGCVGGTMPAQVQDLDLTRMYERSSVLETRRNFLELLNGNPTEPQVHAFIRENRLLLHRFTPQCTYDKKHILGQFHVDFGVLSGNGTLHLIEIEEPGKKILKQDGHRHSHFTHACDQVKDWLDKFSEHRLACLDCFELKPEHVSAVKGVVIMGRDSGCDAGHLRKLKKMDLGDLDFFTYDDVLADLDSLATTMQEA